MEEEIADPIHDIILKKSIINYFKDESLCDVELVTEKKKIYAHKIVLASISMYFRTHFTTNVGSASDRNVIKFLEYDSNSVESIINFIYTGKIHLSMSNIFELMDVEELLQVRNLRCLLSTFLTTALDRKNCWEILMKAEYYGYYSLRDSTFLFILENFKKLIKEPEFLQVPFNVLIKCLDSQVLNVPTEGVLLCNLVSWIMNDYEMRKNHFHELLSKLRPSQIASWNDAVNIITRLCSVEPSALEIIEPWIKKSQLMRNTYSPSHRFYKEVVMDVLFAVGGKTTSGYCVGSMEINLNLPVTPWKLLLPCTAGSSKHEIQAGDACELPLLPTPRHSHAHASNIFTFYVIGGENAEGYLSTVEKYDIVTNSWSVCPPLPYPMTCASAAYLDSCLYISGGLVEDNVHSPSNRLLALREGSKKWVELASMKESRCDHGLVAACGALYAIAGQGEGGKFLCSVERYDPSTDSWMYTSPLYQCRKVFCSTVVDNTIFVVGGQFPNDCNEYNERYDVRSDTWRKWRMYKMSRGVFGGSLGRKVVVVSQTSGHSVQTYSTVSEMSTDGGPPLNHVRIRGSLISLKLPLYRVLPI